MSTLFSKPISEITKEDVESLVSDGQPESGTVEFKESLSCKRGESDKWISGSDEIGEYARNEILAEVVAFANAHGGYLFLGVSESDDHPKRAAGIKPVPRSADLAERLKMQIRDCVEPAIPAIAIRAITMAGDEDGVVVLHVPQSRAAPHRVKPTRECFFRHSNRKEKMTMLEIQDLTIQRNRGVEHIDEVFRQRKRFFRDWIDAYPRRVEQQTTGCRMTLVPVSAVFAENLFQNYVLLPRLQKFTVEFNDDRTRIEAQIPFSCFDERPIVRGTRRTNDSMNSKVVQEAHCDGLVELLFRNNDTDPLYYSGWMLGVFLNGLMMANAFRCGAGSPGVEYAFELELATSAKEILIEGHHLSGPIGAPIKGGILYPRMSLGELSNTRAKLVEITVRDIWNSCGLPFSDTVKVISMLG